MSAARKRNPSILATSVAALLAAMTLVSGTRAGAQQYWDGPNLNNAATEGGTGIWDSVMMNWTDLAGTTNSVYDPGQTAFFGVTGGTVTLGNDLSFTNLTFEVPGYIINGGAGPFTLTPTGTGILNALAGASATINAQITGPGALQIGNGGTGVITLTNGANDYAGGTTLQSGTLFVNADTALGAGTLTITSPGGNAILGSTAVGTPLVGVALANSVSVQGNFSIATNVDAGDPGKQNFTLSGPINLNGATRTITGVTPAGQVHFDGVISNGGVTLIGTAPYVAFIYGGATTNTYTGLTTVGSNAFLVLDRTSVDGSVVGNVLVTGNGSVDYFRPNQIADTATVTVNSAGLDAGGTHFQGFEMRNNNETIDTLLGNGTVGLGSATLTLNQGNFTGAILDGAFGAGGNLTKNSTGTLTLSGMNTYTGITTVNGGDFVNNGSMVSPVTVKNDSSFFNNGVLSVGANKTAVTGATTGTLNNAGVIQGGANSIGLNLTNAGNTFRNEAGATISATTAIVLTNAAGANTILNFGTITGTGGVAINNLGGGTVSLTNVGTINGSVLLGGGNDTFTLVTGQPVSGSLNGGGGVNALRLVGTTEDTLDLHKVSNFAFLNKLGGGTWNLTGLGIFPGGTTVTAGRLGLRDATLISNVVVQFGGELFGNGIIFGHLTNYGIVSPGFSPGKIEVKGDFIQGRSGTLVIEIEGKRDGEFDLLEVGGRAILDGTLRLVRVDRGPRLKPGEKIRFLTARNGVEGEFAEVINPFATGTMVRAEVVYEDAAVALVGTQGSYLEFANEQRLSPNQRVVARTIDKVAFGGDEKKLVAHLNGLPLGEVPRALDRIAPEELTAVYRVGVALADVQAKNITRRMDELRLSSRRPRTAAPTAGSGAMSGAAGPTGARETVIAKAPEDRWGTFFTGTGQAVRVGATENTRGYDMNTGGLTVGVDYRVTPNFAIGLYTGYANTDAEVADNGNLRINGGKLGAYATYFTGGFHADAAISTGYNSYETRRSGLGGIASGRTDGAEFTALLGTGYEWKFDAFTLGPTATLQYARISVDEFSERGSLAPLRVPGQHGTSFSSTLGVASAYEWTLGRFLVRPEVRAAWRHEFGDRSFALDSELTSGAGGLFTVQDSEVGSDSFLIGAGVSLLWNAGTLIYVNYDGELGRQEYDAHNLSGGVRLTF